MTENTRLMGLRCDVVTKEEIKYIVFYDIDRPLTEQDKEDIDNYCKEKELSYLLYRTKHGHHLICLSPVNALYWGIIQSQFKNMFQSYYGGIVIRLSRKKDEIQELIVCNTTYGEVIPNLYNLYCTRFNLKKMSWTKETAKYLLVFEKYRSKKE